tara:strand:- start:290 stop:445 length:156 start_codon:yes stop_codon:yes gene_type:complete
VDRAVAVATVRELEELELQIKVFLEELVELLVTALRLEAAVEARVKLALLE